VLIEVASAGWGGGTRSAWT